MTIGKILSLPLEERFNRLIKDRINDSYINDEGDLINVFSSSELIKRELLKKGIDYKGKDIEDLIIEIGYLSTQKCQENFMSLNIEDLEKADGEVWEANQTEWEQLDVLKEWVLELAFYMCDYQNDKMTLTLKREFKKISQFSSLLRKHNFR